MAWWKYARVGQKVVCVDVEPKRYNRGARQEDFIGLQVGGVYTIERFDYSNFYNIDCVHVVEAPRGYGGCGFAVTRFRPLIDEEKIARRVAEIKRLATAQVRETEVA